MKSLRIPIEDEAQGFTLAPAELERLALLGPLLQEAPPIGLLQAIFSDPVIRCRLCEMAGTETAREFRLQLSDRMRPGDTRADGHPTGDFDDFKRWAPGASEFADNPAHEINPATDNPAVLYPNLSFRLLGHGQVFRVTRSTDRVQGIRWKHVSIHFRTEIASETAAMPVFDAPAMAETFRAVFFPLVKALLPGVEEVAEDIRHEEPRIVQRPNQGMHWEIPITYHVRVEG